jgi:mannitol/fructose-specific phosphotransferase system IIA component (Ntr-type)
LPGVQSVWSFLSLFGRDSVQLLQQTFSNDDTCILDLSASGIDDLVPQIVEHLVDCGRIDSQHQDAVTTALLERERMVSTAIGNSVSVPHCYLDVLSEPQIVFVRLRHAVNLGAPDGIPTRFFFFLLGPTGRAAEHLDTLAMIARLMSDNEFRFELGWAKERGDLSLALERAAVRSTPSEAAPVVETDGLAWSGRFGGGVINDIRRRFPHYMDDIKDGLHPKTIASVMFLFFACLAPAVTFGGVMSIQTGGAIGAVEMIAASAVCGIVYAVVSGQPLIILGGTGPVLIFTALLYQNCTDLQIPFLPTYAWVGFWTALLVVIMSVSDSSCLMRYFTRFTDEIFAALISVIFIYEAVRALGSIFNNSDNGRDTALLTILLALGTFYVANQLQRIRKSRYLLPWMREFISDFGPTIALAAMTIVAFQFPEVILEALPAPDAFGTTTGRSWFVDPFEAPMWVRFAAIGPAIFSALLVFLEQNITARIVNSPDHKLQRGETYHLDLGIVGILIGVCSLFGLPWLRAATVRSLNHVRSLATSEEAVSSDGERHDRIIHVRENRISALAIHIMLGLSLSLLAVLKMVPMAVLYGLFLFMGVVSMKGNQLFERLSLWAMDSDLYPPAHYIRRVPNWKIHAFTAIQLLCLVILWVTKASAIGILFPLFIALLVPVRFLLNRFFDQQHLLALDASEVPEDEATQWS